jgi:hypothetical protein
MYRQIWPESDIRETLMATDRPDLAVEEYRALRATIRERGTARLIVTTITFVSWAAIATGSCALNLAPVLGLIPLLVLAAGFEAGFAMHVGVERLGRFIQVRYESAAGLPGWEHAAMKAGANPAAHLGVDPLFFWPYIAAVVLNLMVVLILEASPVPQTSPDLVSIDASLSPAVLAYALLHGAVVARLVAARRVARRQRERDLALFS